MAGTKSAGEIFGVKPRRSARDIFASKPQFTPRQPKTNFYAHFKRKEGPRQLHIATRNCKKCGGITTSIVRYFCAGCHFEGWWK